ncbi:MAG: flagellar export protein FliJ [Gammaproteobacteria bacterium]
MSRAKRIKAVHDIAAREENLFTQKVSERLFNLQAEERRLEQLTNYLDEYRQLAAAESDAVDISIVRSRRQFVERLQVCVRHQQDLVERLCDQLEQVMEEWGDVRSRSMAIKRFGERAAEQERAAGDRREQAALDQIGLLQYVGKH